MREIVTGEDGKYRFIITSTLKTTENTLTILEDAKVGDYFVIICKVQEKAEAPMTRYAEFVIEIQ